MTRLLPRALALLVSLLLVPQVALAVDFVWTTDVVSATRFTESDSSDVGEIEKGKRVELLSTDGERLRVRVKGASFGWIDKAKTTDIEPPAEPEVEVEDAPAE